MRRYAPRAITLDDALFSVSTYVEVYQLCLNNCQIENESVSRLSAEAAITMVSLNTLTR